LVVRKGKHHGIFAQPQLQKLATITFTFPTGPRWTSKLTCSQLAEKAPENPLGSWPSWVKWQENVPRTIIKVSDNTTQLFRANLGGVELEAKSFLVLLAGLGRYFGDVLASQINDVLVCCQNTLIIDEKCRVRLDTVDQNRVVDCETVQKNSRSGSKS
jgi:hypothetical protein